MSLATINGNTVIKARLQIPKWGVWWATVELDKPIELTGAVSLVIADLELHGTVKSGGPWQGRARYHVAGGAGAWATVIPSKDYSNDLGVKLETIATDAASACGERLGAIPSTRVGPKYVRRSGRASLVLDDYAPQAWYVDGAGVTQFGARTAASFTAKHVVQSHDVAHSRLVVAAESIATLLPGAIVDGVEALDVVHELSSAGLRSTIWGDVGTVTGGLQRIIGKMMEHLRYLGTWEYRVVFQTANRVELQPVRASTGMPDLRSVHVRPGVSGAKAELALGSMVLVQFVNADPSRPVVVGFEDAENGGFKPMSLTLDATAIKLGEHALQGVARLGDTVQAGPFAGVITSASSIVRCQ